MTIVTTQSNKTVLKIGHLDKVPLEPSIVEENE